MLRLVLSNIPAGGTQVIWRSGVAFLSTTLTLGRLRACSWCGGNLFWMWAVSREGSTRCHMNLTMRGTGLVRISPS